MGRWQPYLYNAQRTSAYDVPEVFNPRAATMASRQPPSSPPKKTDGPLINFNKHPDSYLILPYGNTGAKPMRPKVKEWIKWTRWVQLFFRVLTLFGAIGALLCGIFIRGAQLTEGYIIKIPPAVDIVNSLYAIYHLLRTAKSRPAGSSASYHFFALIMDAGFVPCYVFTALLAKRNLNVEAGTDGRWRTFFPTDEETDKVLQTAWLTATTIAGMHIASLGMDLYLAMVFRKISRLPPDMNPLEDNLTSRRKTKHKHKNSSLSAIAPLTEDEKRLSAQSGSTTSTGNRSSQADPFLSEKDVSLPEVNKVAFLHTRNNSGMTYSPHTPNSAAQSRQSLYSQTASARQSRIDLNHRDDLHRRDDGDETETLAQRKSFLAQQAIKRSSRPQSIISTKQDFYTPPSTAGKQESSGDISLQNSRESLQSDNWFVHEGRFDEPESDVRIATKALFTQKREAQGYAVVSTADDISDDGFEPPMMPQPLRMNPPTPPPTKTFESEVKGTPPHSSVGRNQTVTSMSSEATFSRSPTRASTPKSRYYGDLQAATKGIRNGHSPAHSPSASPTKNSFAPNNFPSSAKNYTTNSPIAAKTSTNSPISLDKKSFASIRRTGEAGYTPTQSQSPRVVSRTGVDYGFYDGRYDFDEGEVSDLGTSGRRRDVSGKIAEEGRGGAGNAAGRWGGMRSNELTYRRVSGVA